MYRTATVVVCTAPSRVRPVTFMPAVVSLLLQMFHVVEALPATPDGAEVKRPVGKVTAAEKVAAADTVTDTLPAHEAAVIAACVCSAVISVSRVASCAARVVSTPSA